MRFANRGVVLQTRVAASTQFNTLFQLLNCRVEGVFLVECYHGAEAFRLRFHGKRFVYSFLHFLHGVLSPARNPYCISDSPSLSGSSNSLCTWLSQACITASKKMVLWDPWFYPSVSDIVSGVSIFSGNGLFSDMC